ncbi:hypothetical protein EXIGLDRAFT_722261 [Exidia glandulosa HHB12029]|uniref:Uncharacterized protein n=1 Tax=Exidia glandulosa HHB12029 TaxID=1314781 RepID=A0A165N4H2_EXIGL|nr:hypothetical protein EXIGLDRAFT_722261 [Exidia glandulosa HHB12029]
MVEPEAASDGVMVQLNVPRLSAERTTSKTVRVPDTLRSSPICHGQGHPPPTSTELVPGTLPRALSVLWHSSAFCPFARPEHAESP